MSIYDPGSFGNDAAADLYYHFLKYPEKETLDFHLQHPLVLTHESFSKKAIAAAEIMALYKEKDLYSEVGNDVELSDNFKNHPLDLKEEDYLVAANVLKDILSKSSLEVAWKTVYSDSYDALKENVTILIERLETF